MSWGKHPDTLTIAEAQGIADRSGHTRDSLGWDKAYPQAYEQAANGSYPESLVKFLQGMDQYIAERERTQS